MPLAGSRDSVPCGAWGNAPTAGRVINCVRKVKYATHALNSEALSAQYTNFARPQTRLQLALPTTCILSRPLARPDTTKGDTHTMRYASKDYRKVARQMLRHHPILLLLTLLLTLLCQLPSMLLNIFCLPQPDRTVKDVLSYLFSSAGRSFAQYWYIIIPCALVTAVTVPMLYSVALAAVKDRKPAAKDFTLGLRYAPRAIGLHLLLAVYESLPIIGATLLTSLLANILSWRAYWLLQIVSVIAGVVAVVWTVLIAVSCHAVRYRFVLDPDSGVWDTFKHAREDMNDWRFDLLMTILPIALWYILCLAAQTALVLYAGMLGRVLAEVLPVPILAYGVMTLLLALDDIDTPEEAETAAPKEA